MAIRAGEMRERITIQQRDTDYVDAKKVEIWTDYYSCRAGILSLYGQEKYSAYQSKLENSIKFKVRYCSLLKALIGNTKEFRVLWNGGTYNLLFVDELNGSRTEMILQVNRVS